jgi:hypothetical protein
MVLIERGKNLWNQILASQPIQRLGWHNELVIAQTDDPPALDQAMKSLHFLLTRRELDSHELHLQTIAAIMCAVNVELTPKADWQLQFQLCQ